ncbi:transaldolase [Cellulophaga sp. E16_2]|uniref:transaldolase n=1 Tax=Cellulophaga sp. E16_2 TaxID=2789297 RepID=UPI001A918C0A|nr:transaldolase [Cellulophaga sp. E16_2]MBO0593323.1 transaldolase [Cellulophaga sp. E16_2]
MYKYSFCLLLLSLTACFSDDKDSPTIFAGEIINPTSQTVILYKDDVVVDSAQLDMHNRFSIKLKNLEEGLYNFRHAPQYQYVYLSKGDSLLVRLNTIYFDESLVFSGKGEEINNFLIEVFLNTEEEEKAVNSYFNLSPEIFSAKIDSLRETKISLLEELRKDIELTPKSIEMAKASIDYSAYINKEKYPFKHLKKNRDNLVTDISDEFYDYRDDLNFDDKDLTFYTPYYDYMKRHFDNVAFTHCSEDCSDGGRVIKDQLHFNQHKLKLIDSIVKEKKLRDNLFRNVAMTYFLKVHDNVENNKLFLENFHKLSNNNDHIAEIHSLYESVIKMQPNHELPLVNVIDSVGNSVSLTSLAEGKENVIFYFWTVNNPRHFENITRQVSKLEKIYPETKFIGISLSELDENWKSMIGTSGIGFKNQYRSEEDKKLRATLIIDGLNKAILVKDGIIVDAYKDMYAL